MATGVWGDWLTPGTPVTLRDYAGGFDRIEAVVESVSDRYMVCQIMAIGGISQEYGTWTFHRGDAWLQEEILTEAIERLEAEGIDLRPQQVERLYKQNIGAGRQELAEVYLDILQFLAN